MLLLLAFQLYLSAMEESPGTVTPSIEIKKLRLGAGVEGRAIHVHSQDGFDSWYLYGPLSIISCTS